MGRLATKDPTNIRRCACGNRLSSQSRKACTTCQSKQKKASELAESDEQDNVEFDSNSSIRWIFGELARSVEDRISDGDIVSWAVRVLRLPPGDGWRGDQRLNFEKYPLAAEVLRIWSDPDVERLVCLQGTQTGKSTIEQVLLSHGMLKSGGNCIYTAPTDSLRDKIPRTKILPIMENSPEAGFLKTEQGNTILRWKNGRFVWMALATSADTMADTSGCSIAIMTEFDEITAGLKHDPFALTFDRIRYHHRRKMFVNGTPRRLDDAGLYAMYCKTRMYVGEMPCPHCGEYFVVEDTDLKWPDGVDAKEIKRQKLAYVVCKSCGSVCEDKYHEQMAVGSRLKCVNPEASKLHTGVRIPSWYSVKLPFSEAVFEYLEARNDLSKLAEWYKSIAAKPVDVYKLNKQDQSFSYDIRRSMSWSREQMQIPPEVRNVTAGIDVGSGCFWFVLLGWGSGGRKYVLWNAMYEAKGMGSGAWDAAWEKVLERCDTANFQYLGAGQRPSFSLGVIDSGYDAPSVYDLCKKPTVRRWLPAKGTNVGTTLYKKTNADPERKFGGKYHGLPLILHATHHLQDVTEKALHTPIDDDYGIAFPHDEHQRMFKHLEGAVKKDMEGGATKWDKAYKGAADHLRDALCLAILAGDIMGYNKSEQKTVIQKKTEPRPLVNGKINVRRSDRC